MIDYKTGLRYCIDENFYREVLGDFVTDSDTRLEILRSSFEKKDWIKYKKAVHTLKSLSRTIGATELSDAAEKHQYAAMNGDTDFIAAGFDALIAEYQVVISEAYGMMVA